MNSIRSLVTSFEKLYSLNKEASLIEDILENVLEEELEEEDKQQDQVELAKELVREDQETSLGEKRDVDQSIRQVCTNDEIEEDDEDEDEGEDEESINLLQNKSSNLNQQVESITKDKSSRSIICMIFVDWNPIVWIYLLITFPFKCIAYLFTRKESRPSPSHLLQDKQQQQQQPSSPSPSPSPQQSNLMPPGIIVQLPDEL